MSLYAVFSE
jgi:hypothetical protein